MFEAKFLLAKLCNGWNFSLAKKKVLFRMRQYILCRKFLFYKFFNDAKCEIHWNDSQNTFTAQTAQSYRFNVCMIVSNGEFNCFHKVVCVCHLLDVICVRTTSRWKMTQQVFMFTMSRTHSTTRQIVDFHFNFPFSIFDLFVYTQRFGIPQPASLSFHITWYY